MCNAVSLIRGAAMRRNCDFEQNQMKPFHDIFLYRFDDPTAFSVLRVPRFLRSSSKHTHARISFGRARLSLPFCCIRWSTRPCERHLATNIMGEDVWSLVSRQLNDNTANASRQKEEPKEGEHGEGKTPGGEEDLAHIAENEAAVAVTTAARAVTSFALCVGMPGAGKSTLLNTYLNPNNDSIPKPTVALEYMFARRASAPNMPKVRTKRNEPDFILSSILFSESTIVCG